MLGLSYPRRQQYRRLVRAGGGAAAGLAALVAAVITAAAGAGRLAGVLLVAVLGCLVYTRHWARLAGRSRVGAHSEREVRNALSGLRGEGWRLRHSVRWQGRGDIDTVALAPSGFAFAIESKTRRFDTRHLAHARRTAAWLYRRRRRWCRRGVLPVLCVVHARGLEHVCDEVLVVSLDRLAPALRVIAGTSARPGFLAT